MDADERGWEGATTEIPKPTGVGRRLGLLLQTAVPARGLGRWRPPRRPSHTEAQRGARPSPQRRPSAPLRMNSGRKGEAGRTKKGMER